MDLLQRIAKLSPEQRAQLDARLRRRQGNPTIKVGAIEKRPAGEPCQLSFAQERLWFLEQLEGASATYNIYSATRFRGALHVPCLEQALTEIVRRHESLRTIFVVKGPGEPPVQQVSEPGPVRLEIVEVATPSGSPPDDLVGEWANQSVRQPMLLSQGPLFRASLLRLAGDDHVLTLVMHHIISDGWSLDVLFRELHTLYSDFVSGAQSSLPPLKIQFADFARWQREYLESEELKRHVEYWKGRLAGKIPLLELPSDFSRPPVQSYRGGDCTRRVGPELTEKLRRFGRETDATLFMILLAAFKAQLHRYSGQTDILVGSPVTSRNRIELEPLVGFFVNMLVLRTDFSSDPTVRELILQVRQVTLEALANQDLPFENLVRELHPERSLSHSPLFQVAIMFEEAGQQAPQLAGLKSELVQVDTATSKFDLTLFIREEAIGLELGLEYSTDLFAPETADRMLSHLENLLRSMVADPSRRVSQLELLSPVERQQLVVGWNQTASPYPRDKTVHALFQEQVERTPQVVAVEFGGKRLTYRELDDRAEALAGALREKGAGAGTLVGLFLERSFDMLVGMLGILKAGAAYIPLDPSFPRERLAFMVSDAAIPILVTQERLSNDLPENHAKLVCVDAIAVPAAATAATSSGPASRRSVPGSSPATPESVAYVIYTSGSTGRPKGVPITHRAVVNFLESMRREPGLKAGDVVPAITTLSFDIAGLELYLPLMVGARVVIVPREIAVDGPQLAQLIDSAEATVLQATPSTWRLLLEAGWEGRPGLKVLCGGESLPAELARELLPRCAELWNMYGPTETTIWSTCARIQSEKVIHIGRPIANTSVYILDPHLSPVPIGAVGELYIGGDGLAVGYLNRPELTAEKFIEHPFKPGERLYRTGDLARYARDGSILCLGRVDFQIKIRGYRVELGEIEALLAQHPRVAQAVVTVSTAQSGNEQLIAYVAPRGGPAPGPAELREHLKAGLPDFMVPSIFVPLERLPLTPNGKVDRKALPDPSGSEMADDAGHVAARNPTEAVLADIWIKVLGLGRVGMTDDFFDLGGHSLLAVKLFGEIERRLNRKLPLATLFKAATIESLARELTAIGVSVANWSSLVAIRPRGNRPPLFCVHGAGGNVLLYRDLAARLGDNYPVYGFQSRGLDGHSRPLTTVEEMAEHYLKELKTVQPRGPYRLAGYCLGGMVAFQMARLIRESGDKVSLLALLDAYNPTAVGETSRLALIWQRAKFHLSNLRTLRPSQLARYVREKMRVAFDGELSNLLGRGHHNTGSNGDSPVQQINDHAVSLFRPLPYDGPVSVFKPKVNYDFLSDPHLGWRRLVSGNLELIELPVNPHAMLVEPFVGHLAEALRTHLDAADPAGKSVEKT